jgi:putative tricarboxylic transport membrane protein
MSTLTEPTTPTPSGGPSHKAIVIDRAQYGLAAFLVVAGAYVIYDATGLGRAFVDQPVQPYALPYLVGTALVVLGVVLAVMTSRGDRPEAEEGEDVDLSAKTDTRTVVLLAGVFLVNVLLIDWLGWAITGAFLFAASARVLGSRTWVRDIAIGVALSLASFYGFYVGLGIPIPAGILDGVL